MRKYLFPYLLIGGALLLACEVSAQGLNDWENPDVNGVNKEKPHAYSFLSEQKASNPTVQSLNGTWKFNADGN